MKKLFPSAQLGPDTRTLPGVFRWLSLAVLAVLGWGWPDRGLAQSTGRPVVLGVYNGNDASDYFQFERWLGKPADAVLGYTGGSGQDDWNSSDPGWQINTTQYVGATGRRILWSMAMTPEDTTAASLRAAATGANNARYTNWAQQILTARATDNDPIYVRPTWELGGEWFPWTKAAHEDPQAYIGAWQQFAQSFHGVSSRFKLVWDVVADRTARFGPVEQWYPGDAAVDVISQDVYWQPKWEGNDPDQAFNTKVSGYDRGLAWVASFAAQHGKTIAISEWGVPGGPAPQAKVEDKAWPGDGSQFNGARFIQLLKQWLETHNVVYATYWNSEAAYNGKLSDDAPSAAAAALKTFFLNGVTASAPGGTPPSGGLVSGGVYRLVARHSGKALDVPGNSVAQGVRMQQYAPNNTTAQSWVVERQSDGSYTLTHQGTNQVLDVNGNSAQDGATVQQWTRNSTNAQRWSIAPTDNGYYKVLHKGTSKCLDVNGGESATQDGAIVHQWEYYGNRNQQWRFELLAAPTGSRPAAAATNEPATTEAPLSAYPNPVGARQRPTVTFAAERAQTVAVTVRNQQGELVNFFTVPAQAGRIEFVLPAPLPSGTYFLQARVDGQKQEFILKVE